MPKTGSEIRDILYSSWKTDTNKQPTDVLKIVLEDGETVRVQNGEWHLQNPSLCLQAFLGVSPRTLNEAKGEYLPYVIMQNGVVGIPDIVINEGREQLASADWFNPK